MQKSRALLASFVIAALLAANSAAAEEPGAFGIDYPGYLATGYANLDSDAALLWHDVSGALQFCHEDKLRTAFHNRLSQRRYGKSMASLSDTQRKSLNSYIVGANEIWRGLELAPLTSSQKARICADAVQSAKAFVTYTPDG